MPDDGLGLSFSPPTTQAPAVAPPDVTPPGLDLSFDPNKLSKVESSSPQPENATTGQPEASPAVSNNSQNSNQQQGQVQQSNPLFAPGYPGRPAGWGFTGQNAGPDLKTLQGGFGAMGSALQLRLLQGVPFVNKEGAQPLFRASDLPAIQQNLQKLGNYAMGHWIQPLAQAAMNHQANMSNWQAGPLNPNFYKGSVFEQNFSTAPFSTALELMPGTADTPLNVPATRAAMAVAPHVGQAIGAIGKTIPRLGPTIDTLAGLTPESEAVQRMTEFLRGKNIEYHRTLAKQRAASEKLYAEVTPEQRQLVAGASSYTDPRLRREMLKDKDFANWVAKLRADSGKFQKAAHLSDAEIERNTNGPHFIAYVERHTGQKLSIADLSKGDWPKKLHEYVERLHQAGIPNPPHMAMVEEIQLDYALRQALNEKLGGIKSSGELEAAHAAAKHAAEHPNQTAMQKLYVAMTHEIPVPDYLIERGEAARLQDLPVKPYTIQGVTYDTMQTIQRAEHSLDSLKLNILQMARTLKLTIAGEIVHEAMKLEATSGPSEIVDLHALLTNIAKQTGADTVHVDNLVKQFPHNGQIPLHPKVARLVREVLAGREQWHPILRAVERFNSLVKFGLWNSFLNPLFGIKLNVQTEAINAWTIRTPQELAANFLARAICEHPAIKEVLPNALLLNHSGTGLDPHLIAEGFNFQKLVAMAGDVTYGGIESKKRMAALSYILTSTIGANQSTTALVQDMLHATNGLLKEQIVEKIAKSVDKALDNPDLVKEVMRFQAKNYGDYSRDATLKSLIRVNVLGHDLLLPGRRMLGLYDLTVNWEAHYLGLASTLTDHPLKDAIFSLYARLAAQKLQLGQDPKASAMGMVPMPGVIGPNGKQESFKGWDLAAMGNSIELWATASNLLLGGDIKFPFPFRKSPAFTIPQEIVSKEDSQNGKKFLDENPHIYQKNGQYYHTGQIALRHGLNAIPKEELYKYDSPYRTLGGGLTRAASLIFPNQTQILRVMMATPPGRQNPGIPAVFTQPGHRYEMMRHGQPLTQSRLDVLLRAFGFYSREF